MRPVVVASLFCQKPAFSGVWPVLLTPIFFAHPLPVSYPPAVDLTGSLPIVCYVSKDSILSPPPAEAGTVMRRRTLLALVSIVALYLVMGAVVFRLLEQPHEAVQQVKIQAYLEHFLKAHECQINEATGAGVDPAVNVSNTNASRWDMDSAFFFAGTVITTIGTRGYGQLFCIFYALVGIPLFGMLLAGVGDQLGSSLRKGIGKVEDIFLVSPTIVRILSAVLFILIGCLLFVSLPTLIFQHVEGWSLLESVYFVVITLTTVGFGDYVAGATGSSAYFWYQPLVIVWILVGLAYFASILTMIGNWLRALSRRTRAELRVPNVSFPDKLPRVASLKGKPLSPSAVLPQGENPLSSPPPPFLLQHPAVMSPAPMLCPGHSPPLPQNAAPLNTCPAISPRPIDYTGENLAFIDESSDTLSEGGPPSTRLPRRWRPRARHHTDPTVAPALPLILLSRTRDKGESV
ncbi:hypothetical protein E2320_013877 [Naja naja]|nr:hypothetical protein E2320_013877 [Naja naja]